MKTQENLLAAFAGESQANRKYLAFSKKAEQESKNNLARLFRATAEGETVHAMNHLDVARGVKTSQENLQAAIAGETFEFEEMYPKFLQEAEAENNGPAKMTFGNALKVEMEHQGFYKDALEKVSAGDDIAEEKYFVCQVCGHLHTIEAPEVCPVCGAPKEKFKKVE